MGEFKFSELKPRCEAPGHSFDHVKFSAIRMPLLAREDDPMRKEMEAKLMRCLQYLKSLGYSVAITMEPPPNMDRIEALIDIRLPESQVAGAHYLYLPLQLEPGAWLLRKEIKVGDEVAVECTRFCDFDLHYHYKFV